MIAPCTQSDAAPQPAFPRKALQRWAKRCLTCEINADRISARFAFTGQDCGNLSTFTVEYHLELVAGRDDWHITAARCQPVGGYASLCATCAYKADVRGLCGAVDAPPPFVGWTMIQALRWRPPTLSSGCLCKEVDRFHKWRVVLHTLDHAMRADGASP